MNSLDSFVAGVAPSFFGDFRRLQGKGAAPLRRASPAETPLNLASDSGGKGGSVKIGQV